LSNYSLVKERPPHQRRAAIDAGARPLIYNHWRRCAGGASGAHRRTSKRGWPRNNAINFFGFTILRVSLSAGHAQGHIETSSSWAYSRRICVSRRSMPDPSRVRSGWPIF